MPPTAATREIAINYGGFSVNPDGKIRLDRAFDRAMVEFDFTIIATSEGAFGTAVSAAEDAFRKVRQNLTVTQGGATLISYNHSGSTGFDSYPTIMKREDLGDTGRSRKYTVRIEFGQPADNTSTGGRRSSSVLVDFSPSKRRRITISGVYTTLTGTKSRAQYLAAIDSYANSVLTALSPSGTYELAEESAESNTDDTLLTFRRVYDELIHDQNGQADDPELVRQTLILTRRRTATANTISPENGIAKVEQLIRILVSYDVSVDKTLTTSLVNKWDNIKTWIVSKAKSQFSLGVASIVDESPSFNYDDNRITATMEIVGGTKGQVLEAEITTEDYVNAGRVLKPVWHPSRNKFMKFAYQGSGQCVRKLTIRIITLDTEQGVPFKGGKEIIARPESFMGDRFTAGLVLDWRERRTPKQMGLDGQIVPTVEYVFEGTLELFTQYSGGDTAAGLNEKLSV